VSIGGAPQARTRRTAGYLRVDTVHQGDLDGVKAFTTSTRWMRSHNGKLWERSSTSPKRWLGTLLLSMLEQFPFRITGLSIPITAANLSTTMWKDFAEQVAIEQTKVAAAGTPRQRPGWESKKRGGDPQAYGLLTISPQSMRQHQRFL